MAIGNSGNDPLEQYEEVTDRDFAFLLEPGIYHPLSQLDIPGPFRRAFPQPLPASTSISEAVAQINDLLSQCDYLRAAHLAGLVLISGAVRPTDQKTIFHLLSIRYSCLELSGNILLAAQEAKSLEDLGSTFYYSEPPQDETMTEESADKPLPKHIVPFNLRLQALRLQSIGFSDPRRGVASLYDLGAECREYLSSSTLSSAQRQLWSQRLQEVGVRVVNALVEMNDIDCARRTLDSTKPTTEEELGLWTLRKVTLSIRMGLLGEAQKIVRYSNISGPEKSILESLIAVADDRFDAAIELLTRPTMEHHRPLLALAKQNLAVAYLYQGDIQHAKEVLDTLINDDQSFQTLTINLATILDLTTDRSREMKLRLAERVSKQQSPPKQARSYTNADFKL